MWATLGVYPLAYLPYAFLNLLTPIVSVLYGFTGITMEKTAGATRGTEAAKDPAGLADDASELLDSVVRSLKKTRCLR